jgi:hypothetical protein
MIARHSAGMRVRQHVDLIGAQAFRGPERGGDGASTACVAMPALIGLEHSCRIEGFNLREHLLVKLFGKFGWMEM